MIKTYELTLLARADVSDDDVRMAMQALRDNILANDGTVIYGEYWGLRQLEYPINKSESAYFYMIQFNAEKETLNAVNERLKISDVFIRYLILVANPDDVKVKSSNSNPDKEEDNVIMDRRYGNIIGDVFNIK